MANRFADLAERTKAGWSDETRRVYAAAAAQFSEEMAAQAELGALLAAARTERQLSQQALHELTGIQQAEISRIERGLGNPTAATLLRLTGALGRKFVLGPAALPDPQPHPADGEAAFQDVAGHSAPKQTAGRGPKELAAIRDWAKLNGYVVSSRGRIAGDVVKAYEQQHRAGV